MTPSSGTWGRHGGHMTVTQVNGTFVATTGCVLLATAAAMALIIYSVLTLVELLPAELPAQGLAGLL